MKEVIILEESLEKNIKVQNALIEAITKDLKHYQYNNDEYGMDKYTIKELIRIININYKI